MIGSDLPDTDYRPLVMAGGNPYILIAFEEREDGHDYARVTGAGFDADEIPAVLTELLEQMLAPTE